MTLLERQAAPHAHDCGSRLVAFSVDTECIFESSETGAFKYLELFDDLGVSATFFVVGELGERRSDIVDAINAAGHEIACHGWRHPSIGEPVSQRHAFTDELDGETLDADLARCREVLARPDNPVSGFRAPWFRISQHNLSVIAQHFRYDSSLRADYERRFNLPDGLTELPVSTLGTMGPRMGTSFLFGPGAFRLAKAAFAIDRSKHPLLLYGHSFDPYTCPKNLHTALWKRLWYYKRCGPQQFAALVAFLRWLKGNGYHFVRCIDLVTADFEAKH